MIMKALMFFASLFFCTGLFAQQTVLTCGGTATGQGGESVYSVGQICFNTNSGDGFTITEGVQQPLEILIPIGIDEYPALLPGCSVFPVPADNLIYIRIPDHDLSLLSFSIINIQGKEISKGKIKSLITIADIKDFPAGFYLVRISENDQILRNFNIIKR